MSEWISVKEKLPNYEEKVLLRISLNNDIYIMIGWNCNDENDYGNFMFKQPPYDWEDDGIKFSMTETMFALEEEDVTHWMPLPEPPKDEYRKEEIND